MTPKERAKEALNHFPMYKAMSAVDRRMLENLVIMAIGDAIRDGLECEEPCDCICHPILEGAS